MTPSQATAFDALADAFVRRNAADDDIEQLTPGALGAFRDGDRRTKRDAAGRAWSVTRVGDALMLELLPDAPERGPRDFPRLLARELALIDDEACA